jgi:hypothetical protein
MIEAATDLRLFVDIWLERQEPDFSVTELKVLVEPIKRLVEA